ncbi:hypothetical protein E4U13_000656 [Claviceps humidiphila]|uniref:Uncharacterized protein n=1 Tax=Claviceps humidiphila TaxID=1294629 RepID=A0A9P7QA62_9HYPO|nr:hypothetical protein E4U13_000656 [Claviceps humidiphila]
MSKAIDSIEAFQASQLAPHAAPVGQHTPWQHYPNPSSQQTTFSVAPGPTQQPVYYHHSQQPTFSVAPEPIQQPVYSHFASQKPTFSVAPGPSQSGQDI